MFNSKRKRLARNRCSENDMCKLINWYITFPGLTRQQLVRQITQSSRTMCAMNNTKTIKLLLSILHEKFISRFSSAKKKQHFFYTSIIISSMHSSIGHHLGYHHGIIIKLFYIVITPIVLSPSPTPFISISTAQLFFARLTISINRRTNQTWLMSENMAR